MALVFKDRVKVSSTTAGTGTFTLGSAASGFQDFSVIGNGNTTYYTITDQAGNWEVGIGTYTSSGTTLSRDTILESSNSNSVVDFPAGTKNVFVTLPADKAAVRNAAGSLSLPAVFESTSGGFKFPDGTTQTTAAVASAAKTWSSYTSSATYTVPAGISSIRAYAFGKGGDGRSGSGAYGGGGGCAYGDIAVTAGQTVTISISSGVATVSYGGTTMLTANPGTDGASGGSGGSASKDASVTNGGAYSGGSSGSTYNGTGGGASGSPLGVGGNGGDWVGGGGGGAGGKGGDGARGGGGGGAGGAGNTGWNQGGGGGGAGGPAGDRLYGVGCIGGKSRSIFNAFTDPLMAHCLSPGGNGYDIASTSLYLAGENGGNGGGGGGGAGNSTVIYGGNGGDFGGGGGVYNAGSSGYAGNGGFGGGGGGVFCSSNAVGGNGGYGGGGGGCFGASGNPAGTGGPAIVLIYA